MVVLSNRMPTHRSDQIAWYRAQTSREVPLQGQEIVGDQVVDTGQHMMRCKLGEWKGITVGQPQHQPTLIDVHQVPGGTHGPRTLLLECIEGVEVRCGIFASQGLSTLGGVLSRSVPNSKSHLVTRV